MEDGSEMKCGCGRDAACTNLASSGLAYHWIYIENKLVDVLYWPYGLIIFV